MGTGDRFYLMEMRNRPAVRGDIGSLIKISGLVVTGGGAWGVFLLPGTKIPALGKGFIELTDEEWSDFIQRSDDPQIQVLEGKEKIFHRKVRYEISGTVQQKVWAADGFKCQYCGIEMGKRLMTIDHFIPLEMGGPNDTGNYVTACKSCNKDKGSQDPKDFLRPDVYDRVVGYLAKRVIV